MSFENVEVVRHIYRAWEKEGSPVASGLLDPKIEWVNPPDAVEPGTRQGVDAFGAAADAVSDTFEALGVDIDEMLDAGDRVVVLATLHGRGRGSGAEMDRRQGYIWTIEDGKATRFEWFTTPDEALQAAGLHC